MVAGYGSTPVQPGPILFGNTVVNTAIDTTFSIFETGNTTLHVSNPQITGANAAEFAIKAPSPFPLDIPDGGAAATITLTCTPVAANQRTATLTLTTNDPAHQQVSYSLICNGTTQPEPAFDSTPDAPGPIDFGSATVNTAVGAGFTISNARDADLHVSTALGGANPADFTVLTALPPAIAPTTAQAIQAQCKPSALGIRTATLTFTTDDPNRPTVAFNLACAGEPVPPPLLDDPGQSVSNTPPKGLDGAYGVVVSPDGQNVYVTGYISKAVAAFKRDATTGVLTAIQAFTSAALDGLNGARLIAVSPDGKNLYVASQVANAVVTIDRNTSTGLLSTNGTITNGGPIGTDLTGAYGVVVSSDGRFVYVTGNNNPNGTVVVFKRNTTYGWLTYLQTIKDGNVDGAHGLAISPDGTNLYVTGYSSPDASTGTLAVYKRNPSDGMLTLAQVKSECDSLACLFNGFYLDGLGGAFQVAVSPDGAYVYAVGTYDGAIVVFRRNGLDGSLTRVRTYKDNAGGVDGLMGVSGVAISPDGAHVYTTRYGDKAVAVFERDATTGLLSFGQLIQRNPFTGAPAQPLLDGARDVQVSPDGASVYAAAFVDDAVVGLHTANPTPVLTSLQPGSAQAGGTAFTLIVNGEDFMPGSQVRWNGANRPTTFVNNTQLKADIGAADIQNAGSADVTAFNPAPGGGVSNALKFTITAPGQNPVPSIATLTPSSAPAGGAAFALTVNGRNFIAGSRVRWNGADRPTTFVNSGQLTAQIGAADIAQPGPAGVTVFNPGPGGGTSNAAPFDIAGPGENPTPSITRLSPNQVMADVASAMDITLIIDGINFIAGSQTQWNGMNRPTTFVSDTQLKMIVTTADLAVGGQGSVTVVNPGPGGGASNTATFTVIPIRARVYLPLIKR